MALEYVTINKATLAYRLAGPDNAPLIITLHGGRGFGGLSKQWTARIPLIKSLGDHRSDFQAFSPLSSTYRVLSFDYRGHGQSSRTEPYTFNQIVADIEGMRQTFAGDKPSIICGGSFGGFLAQQYAITYPDHVSHLILRGTAPSYHRMFT